ncbi:hypothetical protein SAQ01S_15500 [Sphingomonas aquatilis NBRC 16722]|jgi:disulfide bond formation protein DsbB|uniref:Disulfide bond formation protein DsbB n=1 Tax=Sphingomonas aquatilis TaxID=93063 RepID=A0AAW3TVX6_9SPHN|nr:hypothetical protein [Sphingomonas aquatilis]MBB3877388.1 disulfide bond formation protein DsbB [Sphingomonas aquatilis]GEM71784.1 hypothetical protein SAQ01S_15500 [Sphingomonas aquatilis NBRC 16722]
MTPPVRGWRATRLDLSEEHTFMLSQRHSETTLAAISTKRFLLLAGLVSILISVATWTLDLTQATYACPFFRVQRSAIGILGILILLLPYGNRFFLRYAAVAVATLGLGVGMMQNFNGGWLAMFKGTFKLHDPIWFDSTILSSCAIVIMSFQLGIIFEVSARQTLRTERA